MVVPIPVDIPCDNPPYVPPGWGVVEHRKGGVLKIELAQIALHLEPAQQKGSGIVGNLLRERLAGRRILNANVLDYLLSHMHLIPKEWRGASWGQKRSICFWGTIYRYEGELYVRYLHWDGFKWRWIGQALGVNIGDQLQAALAPG
jgi:hypothetical protein